MIAIDGYADIERIGRGGLGDVYRATRVSTGGTVAIKVLRDVSDGSVAWHRTRRELTALVALAGHAHVIQLLELLELAQGPALVMEYAPGGSVADLLQRRNGTLTVAEAVLVGRHTAAALVAAHTRGIVHRDIKPQNLLIDAYGQVKLCDFGIAALTRSEEFVARTNALSMRYASPEDLDHEDDLGPPSDVYSLGATLLHLVHGAPPTIKERLSPWLPPSTDDADLAALDAVIAACLHPAPGERPRASQVLDDLERLGWSVDERQRALALDPPSVVDADDEPTVSPPRTSRPTSEGDPTVHRPTSARDDRTVHRSVRVSESAAGVRARPDEDATVHQAARAGELVDVDGASATRRTDPLRPRPDARGWREAPVIVALGVAIAVTATIAVGLWWVADDDGDRGTDPVSTGSATSPVASTAASPASSPLVFADRPDGLPDLTGLVWPFGPVGECLVQVDGRAELAVVPCGEPHDLQRFAVAELDPARVPIDGEFDGDLVRSEVLAACEAAFEPFVGTPFDESELEAPFTAPSASTWADGDRRYQCLLAAPGRRIVGDAAGR